MKLPFKFERKRNSSEPETNLQSATGGLDMETAGGEICSESGAKFCNKSQNVDPDQPIRGLSNLYRPEETGESHVYDIADVLLNMGKLTPEVHGRLRQKFASSGIKSASDATALLLKTGLINANDILEAKASL
jgi:hypothetical protein